MTWSLTASGEASTAEGEATSLSVEQELHAELIRVLSNPRYGVVWSQLRGKHVVSSALHAAPAVVDGDPEPHPVGDDRVAAAPRRRGRPPGAANRVGADDG